MPEVKLRYVEVQGVKLRNIKVQGDKTKKHGAKVKNNWKYTGKIMYFLFLIQSDTFIYILPIILLIADFLLM